LAALPPLASSVLAATWYVDGILGTDDGSHGIGPGTDAFRTIQYAINDARVVAGDTVNVAAGTYSPLATITINKSLTLLGPQANVDPRPSQSSSRSAGSPSEAVVDGTAGGLGYIILIDADNVVINGFEVKSGTSDMLRQSNAHSGTVIKYNLIHDGNGDEGVQLANCTNGIVEYNYVFDIASPGDALNIANSSGGAIRFNEVEDIYSTNGAIYCYGTTNLDIIGNIVRNVPNANGRGIKVGDDGDSSGGHVSCNLIENVTGRDAVELEASNLVIEYNTVRNNPGSYGGTAGIRITSYGDAATISVNNNNIYGNAPYGLRNDSTSTVNAENNWWGCTAGPGAGVCDAVMGLVDYTPWLGSAVVPSASTATATGTGTATLDPGNGCVRNLVAVSEATIPTEGKPSGLVFSHGFLAFNINCIAPRESVTLTITLPSAVPATAQYWKYGPTPGNSDPHWYVIEMGDNDGDNVVTITLVDGGLGDDDLTADGVIIDQGGPGWPPPSGGGGGGVPTFPSIYVGIAAALGAGVLAYFVRRRLTPSR
jgi:hypothetical protein